MTTYAFSALAPSPQRTALLCIALAILTSVWTKDEAAPETAQRCHQVGCGPAFRLQADLPLAFEELTGTVITMCRNSTCFTGSLPRFAERPTESSGRVITFPSPTEWEANKSARVDVLMRAFADGRFWVELWWWPWTPLDVVDGDEYQLLIEDSRG